MHISRNHTVTDRRRSLQRIRHLDLWVPYEEYQSIENPACTYTTVTQLNAKTESIAHNSTLENMIRVWSFFIYFIHTTHTPQSLCGIMSLSCIGPHHLIHIAGYIVSCQAPREKHPGMANPSLEGLRWDVNTGESVKVHMCSEQQSIRLHSIVQK